MRPGAAQPLAFEPNTIPDTPAIHSDAVARSLEAARRLGRRGCLIVACAADLQEMVIKLRL